MLAYILAIIIALASLSLYLSAFFLPELHRKDDFLWSGVGLFYALVLWICAGRITGGVLLGQAAAVAVMLSFGWQTVRLRRAIAHPEDTTNLTGFSLLNWLQNRFGKKTKPQPVTTPSTDTEEAAKPEAEIATTPQQVVMTNTLETEEETLEIAEITEDTTTEIIPESQTQSEEAIAESDIDQAATSDEEIPFQEEITAAIDQEIVSEDETVSEEAIAPSTIEETSADTETEPEEASPTPSKVKPKKSGFSLSSLFRFGKSKSEPTAKPPSQPLTESDLDTWEDEEEDNIDQVTPTEEKVDQEDQIEVQDENSIETEEDTHEQTDEESDTEEKDIAASTDVDEQYVAEIEPFIADSEEETVIENYQPTTETTESNDEIITETPSDEKMTPTDTDTVESSSTEEEPTDKSQ